MDGGGPDILQVTDSFQQGSVQLQILKILLFLSRLQSHDVFLLFLFGFIVLLNNNSFLEHIVLEIVAEDLGISILCKFINFMGEGGSFSFKFRIFLDGMPDQSLFLVEFGCFGEAIKEGGGDRIDLKLLGVRLHC